MKQLILATLFLGFTTFLSYSQSPQAFKYQAVARDASGVVLADQSVSFRISILEGSAAGTTVFTETHAATANTFGLVNLEIGTGTQVTGSFETIDWGSNSYFLKVEMDEVGGSNYQLMGTSQLLSVPYALHSGSVADPNDHDWETSGDDIYSGVSGNVGIGTSSPDAKLEVVGHISQTGTGKSIFLGDGAGFSDNLANNYNTFIGYRSGYDNTEGHTNTGVGALSLTNNSLGQQNAAFGYKSLEANTEGMLNVAVGASSMIANISGTANSAVGSYALSDLTTGDGNTAIGYFALNTNSTGSDNIAIGASSGPFGSTNINGCIFIGNKAGYYEAEDNKLYIENSASSLPLIYGDFESNIVAINGNLGIGTQSPGSPLTVSGNAVITGNMGIGTTTPAVKFHVTGGTDASLASGGYVVTGNTTGQNIAMDENEIMARNGGSTSTLHLQRDGGSFWVHYSMTEINEFMVSSIGRTGIGVATPAAKLHINTSAGEDGVRVQVDGATNFKVHSNGGIANYNVTTPTFALQLENSALDLQGRGKAWSWNLWSDSRVKSKQRTIEYGLKEVMQLQPKSYDHHSSSTSEEGEFIMVTDHKTPSIGFIAQEVQKIIPEAVSEPQDESKDLWSMDYDKLIPVLTKAIQEQQKMIEEMRLEIQALKSQ